ncbi:MAG: DNA-binding domain-containing protein [Acidobacteriia bacterium]|nr:DNA-binding domain-containing protein [Terriglobia bacterium]
MAPLGRADEVSRKIKAGYIKANDRLTPVERLEIYSRSYWYRLIDSMYEDFPGLLAVLGPRAFDKIVRAYLADCPSRSFTLRNLGSRLHEWLGKNKKFAGNKIDVALDMIALEWAHIEAWDAAERKLLGPEDLLEPGPDLRIGLQPHISLLDLRYPVDDLRIRAASAHTEHETASNAVTKPKKRRALAVGRLKPQRIFVAVHRMDDSIYYRRLAHDEFRILEMLRERKPVGRALAKCVKESATPVAELQKNLEKWFASWAELGWLCGI